MVDYSWTTADEIDFLRGIGTYNEMSKRLPRSYWLEQYIKGSAQRRWGKLDEDRILTFAQEELRKCQAR